MLGLLRCTFSTTILVKAVKYFSNLITVYVLFSLMETKYIQQIEHIQQRATKCILNDYTSDYKSYLLKLHILPLMYTLDLNDVMFSLKI